jgi:signal transduction histidine kinase
VRYKPLAASVKVSADVQLLKRVIDNLVSNIVKYADNAKDIVITIRANGNEVKIDFNNLIKTTPVNVTSTKIGLKTCEKIMSQMGGDFKTKNTGKYFTASVILYT